MASSTKIKIPKINTINEARSSGALTTTSASTNSIDRNLKELINITNNIKNNQITEAKKQSAQLINIDKNLDKNITEFRKAYGNFVTISSSTTTEDTNNPYNSDIGGTSKTTTRTRVSSFTDSNESSSSGRTASRMSNRGIIDGIKSFGDRASSGFLPSLALSVATGGALNPVLIQALWGPLKETVGLIKDVVTLPFKALGAIWGTTKNIGGALFGGGSKGSHGLQGETKAVANAKNNDLYKRLDTIINLLEKGNKQVPIQEEKKKSGILSKILGFLPIALKLLGGIAAGIALFKGFNWLKENYEGSLLQKGVQRAGQAWDNIKAGYQEGGFIGGTKAAWGEVKDIGKALWDSVSAWYEKSDLKLTVDEMVDKVKNWFSEQWKGIKDWWTDFDFFKFAGETVDAATNAGKAIWNLVKGLWEKDGENEANGKFSIHGMITKVSNWFSSIWQSIKDWWTDFDFFKFAGDVADGVAAVGTSIWNWIGDLWNADAENEEAGKMSIHGMITRVGDWFKSIWYGIKDWWNSWTIEGLGRGIRDTAVDLAKDIKGIAGKIWDWIGDLWNNSSLKMSLSGMITRVGDWFKNIWDGIKDWWDSWSIEGIATKTYDSVVDVAKSVGKMGSMIWDKIKEVTGGLWSGFKTKIGLDGFVSKISDWFSKVWTGVKDWWDSWSFSGLIDGAKNAIGKGVGKAVDITKEVGTILNEAWESFDIGETIKNGIKAIGDKAKAVFKAVVDWVKNLFSNDSIDNQINTEEELTKKRAEQQKLIKAANGNIKEEYKVLLGNNKQIELNTRNFVTDWDNDLLYEDNNGNILQFDDKDDLEKYKENEKAITEAEANLKKQEVDLDKSVEVNNSQVPVVDQSMQTQEQREAAKNGSDYVDIGITVYQKLNSLLDNEYFKDFFKKSIELSTELNDTIKEKDLTPKFGVINNKSKDKSVNVS